MLEEKVLIWRFKGGSAEALRQIYERYRCDLLKLAALLLHNGGDAEDAVHDVFVSFAQSAERLKLHGSLKGYLLTCVANNARNRNRARQRKQTVGLDEAATVRVSASKRSGWTKPRRWSASRPRWSNGSPTAKNCSAGAVRSRSCPMNNGR